MKIKQPNINYVTQYETIRNFFQEYAQKSGYVDNRKRENIIIKHSFCVVACELTKLSLASIGSVIEKDHATVLHAKRNHADNIKFLPSYAEVYNSMHKGLSILLQTDGDVNEISLITNMNELRERLVETSRRLRIKIMEVNHLHKHMKENPERVYEDNKILTNYNKSLQHRVKKLEKELARVKNLI